MSIHDTKQGQGASYMYIASKDQRGDCAGLGFGSGKAILRLWKDWAVITKWLDVLNDLMCFVSVSQNNVIGTKGDKAFLKVLF